MRPLLIVCFLFLGVPESQGNFKNVILGQRLCTEDQSFCMRASIDHKVSQRYLELNARVIKVSRPGRVTLRLKGLKGDNTEVSTKLVFSVAGKYSQLIKSRSSKLRNVGKRTLWRVASLSFKGR